MYFLKFGPSHLTKPPHFAFTPTINFEQNVLDA